MTFAYKSYDYVVRLHRGYGVTKKQLEPYTGWPQ